MYYFKGQIGSKLQSEAILTSEQFTSMSQYLIDKTSHDVELK